MITNLDQRVRQIKTRIPHYHNINEELSMKKMLLFAMTTALFSCSQPSENTANEAFIKHYFETFNKHDWKAMAAMYADTADFKDPSLGKGIVKQSRENTRMKYAALNQVFPDLHDEVINIYPSGEKNVIVEFVSTGTAPDKSTFELPICTIFTIENGLITKDFTYFDNFEEGGK